MAGRDPGNARNAVKNEAFFDDSLTQTTLYCVVVNGRLRLLCLSTPFSCLPELPRPMPSAFCSTLWR